MDYDLRQLRYFVTIADAGSFSKASLQLGVAQSRAQPSHQPNGGPAWSRPVLA